MDLYGESVMSMFQMIPIGNIWLIYKYPSILMTSIQQNSNNNYAFE